MPNKPDIDTAADVLKVNEMLFALADGEDVSVDDVGERYGWTFARSLGALTAARTAGLVTDHKTAQGTRWKANRNGRKPGGFAKHIPNGNGNAPRPDAEPVPAPAGSGTNTPAPHFVSGFTLVGTPTESAENFTPLAPAPIPLPEQATADGPLASAAVEDVTPLAPIRSPAQDATDAVTFPVSVAPPPAPLTEPVKREAPAVLESAAGDAFFDAMCHMGDVMEQMDAREFHALMRLYRAGLALAQGGGI